MKVNQTYRKYFEKYLSGNCTDDEKAYVENLLIQSPEIHDLFNEYRQIWNYTDQKVSDVSIDVEAAWMDLNKRIRTLDAISLDLEPEKLVISRKLVIYTSRVAAVFVIALGFFFLLNFLKSNAEPVLKNFTASETQSTPLVLADGSEVLMNNGELVYPEEFSGSKREVSFSGNAYFNIAHNPKQPFIINAGGVRVEVLGTSFNLCACSETNETVLCLDEGKVRFSSINTADGSILEQIELLPGQKGIYNRTTGAISRADIVNKNYLAWKTGLLVFEKAPLEEVVRTIEQTYNLQVISDKPFKAYSLTARFENETPETIFETLSTIYGIQYSINGKIVTLK